MIKNILKIIIENKIIITTSLTIIIITTIFSGGIYEIKTAGNYSYRLNKITGNIVFCSRDRCQELEMLYKQH
jgi:hypothetical protein